MSDSAPTLQALLAERGITTYLALAQAMGWTKQQAHMYWHGYRRRRDPQTGAQVCIAVRLGLKVATRLSVGLDLPLTALLTAVPASPVSRGSPWTDWSRDKYRRPRRRAAPSAQARRPPHL